MVACDIHVIVDELSEGDLLVVVASRTEMPESNSALLNAPMRKTVSKEKAPPIMKMRQRLYEPDTLMLPNEPWNPAARLLEMQQRSHG